MEEIKDININIPEGYEIDEEHSTFKCIKFKKKVEKINTWKDLTYIKGYYINADSNIMPINGEYTCDTNKNVFISEKYAKSALALSQISQLMSFYGGEIADKEWENDDWKYSISVDSKGIIINTSTVHYRNLLAFHTEEQRDEFISFPENIQLIKDFFMVD